MFSDAWQHVLSLEASYGFLCKQSAFVVQTFPRLARISFDGSFPQFLDIYRSVLTMFPCIRFNNIDVFWYWLVDTPFDEQLREIRRLGVPPKAGQMSIDFFRRMFEHQSMEHLNVFRVQCDVLVVIGQLVCLFVVCL